jgi:hypothetical protein
VPTSSVLAQALIGRALLVVDEAYVEFSDVGSVADLIDRTTISPCCAPCPRRGRWRVRASAVCWPSPM